MRFCYMFFLIMVIMMTKKKMQTNKCFFSPANYNVDNNRIKKKFQNSKRFVICFFFNENNEKKVKYNNLKKTPTHTPTHTCRECNMVVVDFFIWKISCKFSFFLLFKLLLFNNSSKKFFSFSIFHYLIIEKRTKQANHLIIEDFFVSFS